MQELRDEDPAAFRNYHHVDRDLLYEILERLVPQIEKIGSHLNQACVCLSLCSLGTGDSFHSLSYSYRVAHNTKSKLVYETCEAIISE